MLNSKQRAYLKSISNGIDTILIIGKGGLSDPIMKQAEDALHAREIIKGRVLESTEQSVDEIASIIAKATHSEVVQTIGSKFILYRKRHKDSNINLP